MKSPDSKNTTNWQQSMDKRNKLVDKLGTLGIEVERPHEMRLKNLELLVNNHRMVVESNKIPQWEYLSYSKIARLAGTKPSTLIARMHSGLTLEESLLKPVRKMSKKTILSPEQIETAKNNGITRKMLYSRINYLDWTVGDAITLQKGTKKKYLERLKKEEANELELNVTKEERRTIRKQRQSKRLALLDKINKLEADKAGNEEIEILERELANV